VRRPGDPEEDDDEDGEDEDRIDKLASEQWANQQWTRYEVEDLEEEFADLADLGYGEDE
jgi:hypothetical protein